MFDHGFIILSELWQPADLSGNRTSKRDVSSEPIWIFRRQRERCAVKQVCSQGIKKPEPLSVRDPGVRPSYALHSLVVNSTLTPVAQNLHKLFIAHPMACQRFAIVADAANLPLLV